MDLKKYVTIVPDYPKEGVQFKDITTLMDKGDVYRYATDQIVTYAKEKEIDLVVGPEARGFIIGQLCRICAWGRVCACPQRRQTAARSHQSRLRIGIWKRCPDHP